VQQESTAIDAQFEKKKKQAEVGWKISQSTALNTSRLQVLRARAEHLEALFEEARNRVKELSSKDSKGGSKYQDTVENLILEVLLILVSPDVSFRHKQSEESVIKQAGDKALKRYKDVSGRDCKIDYVGDLGEDTSGGVIGSTLNGKIMVDNTLDERLTILEEKMLPEIRTDLFGKNENRKFTS